MASIWVNNIVELSRYVGWNALVVSVCTQAMIVSMVEKGHRKGFAAAYGECSQSRERR